ncbi:hypothetical protein RCL1_001922 [Eukaryota sp. TZLM3-RCL]
MSYFELPDESFDLNSWLQRLNEIDVSQKQLDELVMDYLVVEGYKDAAEAFAEESGVDPGVNLSTMEQRMAVRASIVDGNIDAAKDAINNIDVEILEKDKKLLFSLQIQRLIELIRAGLIDDAISYAQSSIAVHQGDEDYAFEEFLPTLEEVMALLLFPDPAQSPLAKLVDVSQRLTIASNVNSAILSAQALTNKPRVTSLIQGLSHAQEKLSAKQPIPKITEESVNKYLAQSNQTFQ